MEHPVVNNNQLILAYCRMLSNLLNYARRGWAKIERSIDVLYTKLIHGNLKFDFGAG
jgi:hypothetical protein